MSPPDVVVVGGGIAGVSVADELARHGSVLLVEAEDELARHSTGRSAASYIPGHGDAPTRELIAASRERFDALADEAGFSFLRPRPVLWTAHDDADEQALATMHGVEPVTVGEARRRWPALRPDRLRAAALTADAADVDALALHQHRRRSLRARGGTVRTGAPVTALAPRGDGWRVRVGDAEVDTVRVVLAAGAWTDRVLALAGVAPLGLVAHRRTIAVVRVPPGATVERDGPFVIHARERWYTKPEGDFLLVSPAEETPAEPADVRPEELDVAAGLERVNAVTDLGLRSVSSSWTGLRTFAPDRRLVLGDRPAHPGLYLFAGQGGSGIESSPAAAALAAAVVRGVDPPADVVAAGVDPAALAATRF